MQKFKETGIVWKMRTMNAVSSMKETARKALCHKSDGIDGIMVTVGLCIIALVLCVLMKDQLGVFVKAIVSDMTKKAQDTLSSSWT